MNILRAKSWPPYAVGAGIGILSWFAFATADHPLGVSTAFEDAAALTERAVVPGAEQSNAYFAAKAEEGKSPTVSWEWMVVVGIFVGALISSRLSGDRNAGTVPDLWRKRLGSSAAKRLAAAFIAGAVMMFGARLAQGCTSGHGISGSLQLAASSWVFSAVFFAVATLVAILLYGRKEEARHV
jgi:uncharacterized protein